VVTTRPPVIAPHGADLRERVKAYRGLTDQCLFVQDRSTEDMIFSVGEVIAHFSRAMTLVPGSLIATGPSSRIDVTKGWFLRCGDEVEVEIATVGQVRTPMVAAPPSINES